MKKILQVIFVITIGLVSAQTQRFGYDYRFVPDSTNRADVKTDYMNLDITDKGSRFYSAVSYAADSTMRANMERQLKSTNSISIVKDDRAKSSIRYTVTKDYPSYATYFHQRIWTNAYKVAESRNLNWKILQEKEKVGEWMCQKAELDFAGRKWIACFTTDIPFQDGPYKFHGLPGLIVKISDQSQSHQFELTSIKKLKESPNFNNDPSNEITLSNKRFATVLKQYEDDPMSTLKSSMSGVTAMVSFNGKVMDNTAVMKEREKEIKSRIAKNNNKIELRLD